MLTLRELQELDVVFVSLTEAFDLTTSTGRAMAAMVAVFAEFEREIRSERVRAGIRAGALVRWRGGLLPARSADAGGGPPSRERGAGGVDRDPQPGDERGRAGGPDHGGHGGGIPGVETPGGGGGDGAQAGEAGVPLFAELGQG